MYRLMLGISQAEWISAGPVLEELADKHSEDSRYYRVMTALDYVLESSRLVGTKNTGNAYLYFILLVCSMERLFSKSEESSKGIHLAERMSEFLSGAKEKNMEVIKHDYRLRNDLVHAQGLPQIKKEEVRRCCDDWQDFCIEVFKELLLKKNRIAALPPARVRKVTPRPTR